MALYVVVAGDVRGRGKGERRRREPRRKEECITEVSFEWTFSDKCM